MEEEKRETTPSVMSPADPGSKANQSFPSTTQISRPYFTSSEISYLHSKSIDDNHKTQYNRTKHQIYQFAFQIVKQLKFPLRVLATTMNYYQRFYLFNKFHPKEENVDVVDLERDPYIVTVACLFLASKNEDCIKKLKDIQTVANKLRDIDENKKVKELPTTSSNGGNSNGNGSNSTYTVADLQRKSIMSLEFKLLQIIKFDFNNGATLSIKSSDELVTQFCKKLDINYKLSLFSWLINFDLISSPLCLSIPPHCIALAIIIIALNLKPKELKMTHELVDEEDDEQLNEKLETIDSYGDFRCPEVLVNEGIIYILDYYIHQYSHSILNQYLPHIDAQTGKEQIFKFMELKSRFNDLKILNEYSCSSRASLQQDNYLQLWDYSVPSKGTGRFMLGNKRRRFAKELDEAIS
ncbi:cyclin-like protein [Scheffersomyces xylosifermentans]|uniref:cyclin-like protein n=1 Tax=Scheffersomyces xylosifermentans TaxID=1304137 RepID=UPI00315C732E